MITPNFFKRSELTRMFWRFRREFLIVGIFSMIANLLMLSPTLYMLQVYDRVLTSQSDVTLIAISLVTLFLFGVGGFAEWMRSRVLIRTGVSLDTQLGTQVFNASFEAQINESSAEPTRSFNDLIQIRQFLTGNGIFAFFDAPWTPIYMMVLFILHPLLGVMGIVFALIQAALAWFGQRNTLVPAELAAKAQADASSYLQSKLRNSEVIESMGMVRNLQTRWAERHDTALARGGDAQHLTHRIVAISKFVRYTQQSLVLGAGALLVIDGQISPGAMIAANVLMTRALAPVDLIVSSWRQFAAMRTAFTRLETLLAKYPPRDPSLKRVAPTGQIALKNVFANATGRSDPILKGISLAVEPGTVVAVLGPSGSGKSTLARVLVGIWPQLSGDVTLDASPLAGWNRTELGPHLGYLPQDIELFEGSIAENISRFGQTDADKVLEASKSAGLHEMILRFPKGYNTSIGEFGSLLSGGQRQRIGLARAIYGNPAIVVLDEPNSNLDDIGETALNSTIVELKTKGKTVFVISHRTNVIAVADRIIVLRDGNIQVDGTPEVVLASLRAAQPATKKPSAAQKPPDSTSSMPGTPAFSS